MSRGGAMSGPAPRRWGDLLAILFLAAGVAPLVYAVLHVRTNTADVTQWLPADIQERRQYDWFLQHFGVDDWLMVSWPGSSEGDPRLDRFASAVERELGGGQPDPARRLVERVLTPQSIIEGLSDTSARISLDYARQRLEGILLGKDGGAAAVMVEASQEGRRRQHALLGAIQRIAQRELGLGPDDLRMGGSVFEGVTIDRESIGSLRTYVVPSGLMVLFLAFVCLRDVRLVAVAVLTAVYCQLLSVGIIYYAGASLNAVLIVMPTLVYVTTISGAIHLINYYRGARRHGMADPVRWAMAHGWRPCAVASVTTAMGIGSLMLTQVRPVRQFGFYSSIAIVAALGVLLVMVPAGLRLWPAFDVERSRSLRPAFVRATARYSRWLVRRHGILLAICLVLIAAGVAGLVQLRTSLDLRRMFPPESLLVRNYSWLEREIGPLTSIEIILAVDDGAPLDLLQRVELVRRLEDRLRTLPEVQATWSPAMFVPPVEQSGSLRAVIERATLRKRLAGHLDELAHDGLLATDGDRELWRITARVSALGGWDYGALTAHIRSTAEEFLARDPAGRAPGVSAIYTGLTPVLFRAQQQILWDLLNSFLGAFAMITPLMMLRLRSVAGGLVAMLPNLAPVVLVFGVLGWAGVPVDIGIVLTASVGLGIAVDGTMHFLGWYQQCRMRGQSKEDALEGALRTIVPPLIQATLMIGLGTLVFALSSFLPSARFAWLLLYLLLAALLGDLLVLPVLIAGPLGRTLDRGGSLAPQPAKRMDEEATITV